MRDGGVGTATANVENNIIRLDVGPVDDLGRQFGYKGGRVLVFLGEGQSPGYLVDVRGGERGRNTSDVQ